MSTTEPGQAPPPGYERGSVEFDRALSFFDATFAFALTLLVTTLDGAHAPSTWASVNSLMSVIGTQLFAFALSFAVIAFYWLANHQFFACPERVTRRIVIANLFMVACVVLLPFTTEALGDLHQLPLPTAAYAVNIAAASATEAVIFLLAWTEDLIVVGTRRAAIAQLVPQVLPPAVFLGSVPVAYVWSPAWARVAWLSLGLLGPIARRWATRDENR